MARLLLRLFSVHLETSTPDGSQGRARTGSVAPVVLALALLLLAVLAVVMVLIGARPLPPAQSPALSPPAAESEHESAARPEAPEPAPTRSAASDPDPLAEIPLAEARAAEIRGEVVLYGRVRNALGERVAGAEIWRDGIRVARTDAEGRYRFQGLLDPIAIQDHRPRYALITAYDPRWGSDTQEGPVRSGALDFCLEPHATVLGQAWDAKSRLPVANTRVEMWCFPEVAGLPQRRAFQVFTGTDGRGAFQFLGVPRGRIALRAAAEGYGMPQWRQFVLSGDLLRDAFLEMQETRRVRGRFRPWPPVGVDDPGRLRLQVGIPELLEKEATLSAEDGSFELEFLGRPGVVGIALLSDHGVLLRKDLDALYGGNPADVGTLLLDVPGGLSGRVSCPPQALELGLTLRTLPLKGSLIEGTDFPLDPSGRFLATPLPDGTVTLGVMAGSQLVAALGLESVRAGEIRELEERTLRDPVVAGFVRDAEGSPCRGHATVELQGRSSPDQEWSTLVESLVDGSGRYVLRPPAARWQDLPAKLRVLARLGQRTRSAPAELEPGPEAFCRVDLTLLTERPVAGVLYQADGSPAASWSIVLRDPARGEIACDVTAGDGSFLLYGLTAGPVEVTAEPLAGEKVSLGVVALEGKPLRWTLPGENASPGPAEEPR